VYATAKNSYAETRGITNRIDSKYKKKLKRLLKQLEDVLQQKKIVYCAWKNHFILQIMFCTGLLVYISINIQSGDITNIVFDKFLIDKLISDTITDGNYNSTAAFNLNLMFFFYFYNFSVLITKQNIIIAYNINQITFISFQKITTKSYNSIEKINDRNPIIYNVLISGDKKISRYLVCNKANDMLMIWTKSSQSEVFPWRPTAKDQDRANLHIYLLSPMKIELLSYYWTENDPICLEFSIHGNNQINIVEQKISKKVTKDELLQLFDKFINF
jgi:WD repeat-containing and planar cell polarity effector protein